MPGSSMCAHVSDPAADEMVIFSLPKFHRHEPSRKAMQRVRKARLQSHEREKTEGIVISIDEGFNFHLIKC